MNASCPLLGVKRTLGPPSLGARPHHVLKSLGPKLSSRVSSISSTATASTAGATGCFSRRAAFFTGARLGLALATVRFLVADFATFRGLPRLAEFPLRSFARFCTFDRFLRLAMIVLFRVPRSPACAVANYCPKTSNSISTPREKITQTNIILMLICVFVRMPPQNRLAFLEMAALGRSRTIRAFFRQITGRLRRQRLMPDVEKVRILAGL
jgi:hypothetical protein